MEFIVSIVGRPNVGKSTFFNRILGYRKAITDDTPGVTRDRNYGEVDVDRHHFLLVDTGGFEPSTEEGYFPLINRQIEVSIQESAAVIFVMDVRAGLHPQDREIERFLRKSHKPVIHVINKVDSPKGELDMADFYALGAEELFPVSALHGLGIGEVLDRLIKIVDAAAVSGAAGTSGAAEAPIESELPVTDEAAETGTLRIALVGRPNVGKSSLTNRLIGSERMIVSASPGTTRDSIDATLTYKGKEVTIIDTAGLRKKSRISARVEEYSVASAIRSVERADVVNLVIDAEEGASHQDAAIAHLILSRGKGLCVVVNKWDLMQGKMTEGQCRELLSERMPHAAFCPVLFASAVTGQNVRRIIEADLTVFGELYRRIATAQLNTALGELLAKTSIPRQKGKSPSIHYGHQVKTAPPTFVFFANFPELVPENYRRYLENGLRARYGFHGVPLRLMFKKK